MNQSVLKDFLHYDPESGVFTWVKSFGCITKNTIAKSAHSNGYIHIAINKKRYYAHRLAFLYMTGSFPDSGIDHINSVRNDNRWVNLRCATQAENCQNSRMKKRNTSGFTGVRKHASGWQVAIMKNGNNYFRNFRSYQYGGDNLSFMAACFHAENKYRELGFHENHGKPSQAVASA